MPEVLSWEVPGETVLEPAPSFPRAQVPGGAVLCAAPFLHLAESRSERPAAGSEPEL